MFARGLELADQVLRHALGERLGADEDRDAARVPGEMQRRLAGRVATAHDVDVLSGERLRVADGGAVEDARADQLFGGRDAEAAVGDTGREHDHRRARLADAVDRDGVPAVAGAERDRLARQHELRPEDPRLLVGALRELGAR